MSEQSDRDLLKVLQKLSTISSELENNVKPISDKESNEDRQFFKKLKEESKIN